MKISNPVKVKKSGHMANHLKENTKTAKKMEKAKRSEKMALNIKETFVRIKCMERVSIYGEMEINIRGNLRITKCMGKGFFNGKMGKSIVVNTKREKKKEKESLHGLTNPITKVLGRMANSTAKVTMSIVRELERTESGRKAKGKNGSRNEDAHYLQNFQVSLIVYFL